MAAPQLPLRLVSIAEGAKHMEISERTVRRRIATGELIAYRFGPRLIRVDADALEGLLEPMEAGGTPVQYRDALSASVGQQPAGTSTPVAAATSPVRVTRRARKVSGDAA